MLDITNLSALSLDLTRGFTKDPGARLRLLDGSGQEILTLTMTDSGWDVTDGGDGSISVQIVGGIAATVDQLRATAGLVYYPTDADSPVNEWGGAEMRSRPWVDPWDRVWSFDGARPQGVYTGPEADAGGYAAPWLFYGTAVGVAP